MDSISTYADRIANEAQLDERLTAPRAELVEFMPRIHSPLLVLGAGGKMGPTLAVLANRAAAAAKHPLRVIAASRFTKAAARTWLEERGVETVACDLMDRAALAGLPDAPDIVYLVGLKFGTARSPALTWATNTLVPANVAERFPQSRMVALSTGNVYPLVPVDSGGATEEHALTPLGEYANAAIARERILEFRSQRHGTAMTLLRLNYAVDLRYGVLHDLAQTIRSGKPVDLTCGYFNCIWQGDANDRILRALALAESPPAVLNLTGPDRLSVREIAERLARLMNCPVNFSGVEASTALLSNAARSCACFGTPPTPLDDLLRWTAHWIMHGGVSLNQPTHFEVRDGQY